MVGSADVFSFRGFKKEQVGTLVLRGGSNGTCLDLKEKVKQALRCLDNLLNSKKVVAVGGAIEGALNVYLTDFAFRHVIKVN